MQALKPPRSTLRTSDYYTSRYKSLLNDISTATKTAEENIKRIDKYRAHSKQYYCFQCELWVDPHFDYEQVSSGGAGMMLDNGLVIVRQNNSTREYIRCSSCGKKLEYSGSEWADQEIKEYNSVARRLKRLHRRKQNWFNIIESEETHPILVSVRRFHWGFPWVIPSLVVLMLIGAAHLYNQHLAATALVNQADTSFHLAISATRPYDRLCNLRNYVRRFPDSPHIPKALTMLSELEQEHVE